MRTFPIKDQLSSDSESIKRTIYKTIHKAINREDAVAWIPVVSYYLRYNTADKQPVVGIYYRDGGAADGELLAQHFPLPPQDALFIADMLRNEEPVYFDPRSGALASGKEEVGEGEPD